RYLRWYFSSQKATGWLCRLVFTHCRWSSIIHITWRQFIALTTDKRTLLNIDDTRCTCRLFSCLFSCSVTGSTKYCPGCSPCTLFGAPGITADRTTVLPRCLFNEQALNLAQPSDGAGRSFSFHRT